ncbi:MAG: glycosyltransferase family 4 protein, partial [Firmicutes bacterium]|nr:glycosyltransferase family 4 protein [Bacillota bacterium]
MPAPLRVLYLINFAGKSGSEKYVENLVRLLGGKAVAPYFAYSIPGPLSEKMGRAGVPCLRLNLSWRHALGAAKELAAYCKEHGIDVIHAQFPRENIIALLAKRHYPALRVVWTSHLTLALSGFSGALWRLLNRRFTPKNHRVIALYARARDQLVRDGVAREKIVV